MVINLTNSSKSDIKWELISFPDGHKHINFNHTIGQISGLTGVVIKTRIKTYDDMFILKQTVAVVREMNPKIRILLYISYLLASRYDREMHDYDSFDLKIVCNDINALNFTKVTIVEPHSIVTISLLNNVEVVHPLDLPLDVFLQGYTPDNICFVVPDLGAVKRVETFLTKFKRNINIVYSNKHRNLNTGEITGIDIFNSQLLKENVIIYDDLCDGGRTFIELTKVLRITGVVKYISLFVTHGIFSQGIDKLLHELGNGYLDEIYTTNSYKEQNNEGWTNFKSIDII
jgi:ribose-phosphate pyrophosphokinase